ncbi:hypothetical protein [Okeania sp. SIO2G4]|uniref:DUF6888 family protein n=1 Tax=unclassified Okeania TaxID=2634635 RepID=UPI0035C920F4
MPTKKQKETAIFICQLLSNLYNPINLFRYNKRLKIISITKNNVILPQDFSY